MKISLDFDDTYTRDPLLWDRFIRDALKSGHDIRIVTFRKKSMTDPALGQLSTLIPVIYTGFEQKRQFCNKLDFIVDVWIDDSPEFIIDR